MYNLQGMCNTHNVRAIWILSLLLFVFSTYGQVTLAEETPEQFLERLENIPLPDETINDRGLMIEALTDYIKTYIKQAAEFHEKFPDHPKGLELAEREISMITQIRQHAPSALWQNHIERLKKWNPKVVADSNALILEKLQSISRELLQAQKKSPKEFQKARQEAFDWAVANANFEPTRDFAYGIAVKMETDVSAKQRRSWFEKFRRAFPDDPRSRSEPDFEPAVEVGQPLILHFEDLNEKKINTADFRGKIVVVDFWATWCVPCLQAGKVLKKLYGEYSNSKSLEIIGVSIDRKREDLEKFLAKDPYPWPIIWDGQQKYAGQWEITAIPYYLIVDQKGILRLKGNTGQLRTEILKYLDEKAMLIEKSALLLSENDLKPLASNEASADQMFETLISAEYPDYGATRKEVGQEAAQELFSQRCAAYAMRINDLAWVFLEKYPEDQRISQVLQFWVWSTTDRHLDSNPQVAAKIMKHSGTDIRHQIEILQKRYAPLHHREVELAALIHKARVIKQDGKINELGAEVIRRLLSFCETKPDDLLNVPAFFCVMEQLKDESSGDPALQCPAPLCLRAVDFHGQEIDTSRWKGKVVFVYFSYYPQQHLPMLRQLWREHHNRGLEIVEINIDKDKSNIEKYIKTGKAPFEGSKIEKEEAIPWPVVVVSNKPCDWHLSWLYGSYASLCVLDQHGCIRHTSSGWRNWAIRLDDKSYLIAASEVPEVIESLLAKTHIEKTKD